MRYVREFCKQNYGFTLESEQKVLLAQVFGHGYNRYLNQLSIRNNIYKRTAILRYFTLNYKFSLNKFSRISNKCNNDFYAVVAYFNSHLNPLYTINVVTAIIEIETYSRIHINGASYTKYCIDHFRDRVVIFEK
jgi:hypothetical protein